MAESDTKVGARAGAGVGDSGEHGAAQGEGGSAGPGSTAGGSQELPLMEELQATLEALAAGGHFTPSSYPGAGLGSFRRDELFSRLHHLSGERVMPLEHHPGGASLAYRPDGQDLGAETEEPPASASLGAAERSQAVSHRADHPVQEVGETSDPFRQPGLDDPTAYTEFYPWPQPADGEAERQAREGLAEEAGIRLRAHRSLIRRKRVQKLAWLLHLEVERIVDELELRQTLLLKVWSKMRIRAPLLRLLRCRYEKIRPTDLLLLPLETLELLERFYRKLDEFRLYLQVTEDMPTTLATAWQQYKEALTQVGRPLLMQLKAIHRYEGLGVELPLGTELDGHS